MSFALNPPNDSHTLSADQTALLGSTFAGTAEAGHFDELRHMNGALREPWRQFFDGIGPTGLASLPDCAETVARVIAQNGITYNVFAKAQGQTRPWSVNPLPMLIAASEWQTISQSLAQRARLLNHIVHDVYHEQALLKAAYLPSALVLGNPGYMHSMRGVHPPSHIYLHVVAFDIARDPEGNWWVVGQRTQSPSGLGYVLENRLIVSRLFPQAYRDMRVQHIASSYRRLLEALEAQARPMAQGTPRFALLTSGPHSETYFEHAYLARYLGIPLVEGPDLTVRHNQLFLKTIQGLQRIHGILRRLDDDFCDPLELRADSTLGVPGLLQAVRAGNVVMANALGTGFLESPAIQGFLPAICEHLLGEPLAMPSLNTWWCGEQAAWQDISPKLHSQVIKPTFPNRQSTNFDAIIASLLNKEELDAWRVWIDRRPEIYTTQTYLPFSQVPTWRDAHIEPRTAMVRLYAVIGEDGDWQVMPGGMTRVAAVDPHIVSIRSGGSTLDTWVMTDEQVDTYSMLPKRVSLARWKSEDELVSSRSAENLFWLGRYTERAECRIRLAREALVLLSTNRRDSLPALNEAISELSKRQGLVSFEVASMTESSVSFGHELILRLTESGVGGLLDNFDALERSMRAVRDRLPPEHVEIPARLKELLTNSRAAMTNPARPNRSAIDMIETLDRLELPVAALVGFQLDRMTRDLGWHLLSAGRLVERLINLGQSIEVFFRTSAIYTPRGFDSLLTLFDSAITYRTRYQRQQDIPALLDLLVWDTTNPRAIQEAIAQLKAELSHLPEGQSLITDFPTFNGGPQDLLSTQVDLVNQAARQALTTSDEISKRFFAHVTEQHYSS
jgi:uncharacterized circularly permuted ATP-grasp superfamily protein/uncharacterized alpha-E superfamily protein